MQMTIEQKLERLELEVQALHLLELGHAQNDNAVIAANHDDQMGAEIHRKLADQLLAEAIVFVADNNIWPGRFGEASIEEARRRVAKTNVSFSEALKAIIRGEIGEDVEPGCGEEDCQVCHPENVKAIDTVLADTPELH